MGLILHKMRNALEWISSSDDTARMQTNRHRSALGKWKVHTEAQEIRLQYYLLNMPLMRACVCVCWQPAKAAPNQVLHEWNDDRAAEPTDDTLRFIRGGCIYTTRTQNRTLVTFQ
jgi:hypothetical protein